jgi:hypothetical protein
VSATRRGTRDEIEPLPGWIAWPIRVLAVIFVVPFRLAWDALAYVGRFIGKYVLKPFAEYVLFPVLYYVIWVPLRFLAVYVLWRPLAWVAVHVLFPVFQALWDGLVWFVKALGPFWRLLGRVLLEMARAVAFVMTLLYRYLLRPIGLALRFVWVWIVTPVGRAVAWAWKHSVVLLWRYLVVIPISWAWRYLVAIPVSWVWRTVVVPPARWVRIAVLHPIAETTRRVLASLGLR